MLKFEWDVNKAKSNIFKHGISFEECKSAFYDENGIFYIDEKHSEKENRYLLIGKNIMNLVVLISYTIRNHRLRIISCRKANKFERKIYEEE